MTQTDKPIFLSQGVCEWRIVLDQKDDGSWNFNKAFASSFNFQPAFFEEILEKKFKQIILNGKDVDDKLTKSIFATKLVSYYFTTKQLNNTQQRQLKFQLQRVNKSQDWLNEANTFLESNLEKEALLKLEEQCNNSFNVTKQNKHVSKTSNGRVKIRTPTESVCSNAAASTKDFKFDKDNCKIFKDIKNNKIDWDSIEGCHYINGGLGSKGVLCVQLTEGVIVLKSGSTVDFQEYFANILLQKLKIDCPDIKIIDKAEVMKIIPKFNNVPFTNPNDFYRPSLLYKYRSTMIMEMKRGNTVSSKTFPLIKQKEVISQIGRIVAFDMLINNFDRIPLIWNNEGNEGNLLIFRDDNGKCIVTAIDQITTMITSEKLRQKYEETIKSTYNDLNKFIKEEKSELPVCLTKVEQFFNYFAQQQLTHEQLQHFSEGVLNGIKFIAENLTKEMIDTSKQEVLEIFGATNLHVSTFIEQILAVFVSLTCNNNM